MKAKIKGTNKIIDVYGIESSYKGEMLYKEKEWSNECFKESALDFDDAIDWEQRRFELVKAALPACIIADIEQPLGTAIRYADNVVYLLKTSGKEK